jgi:hypothetical protein
MSLEILNLAVVICPSLVSAERDAIREEIKTSVITSGEVKSISACWNIERMEGILGGKKVHFTFNTPRFLTCF